MLSREAKNTNFIVFGLIQPGCKPTIYCIRGEHANHYTTDAVKNPTQRIGLAEGSPHHHLIEN
jgi:hypothetical protein